MSARALLDTSVFIAADSGRELDWDAVAAFRTCLSVVTVAELRVGIGLASDPEVRMQRAGALAVAEAFEVLPVEERSARVFADLQIALRRAGRRASVLDGLIAATAIAEGMPVLTQDRDFLALAEHGPLEVVLV